MQSNAIKFTEKGSVQISVSMDDEFFYASVKDTGAGISQENQTKLFKLFGFLEETKQQNKNGVGLGLAISKQIVE